MRDGDICLGLRERKKLATREALVDAAIRLALRDGPENVRVPVIAAEAGVSPRTFNNYFSSVPEAICAPSREGALRIGDALRDRPASEPLAEAIGAAMIEAHTVTYRHKEQVRLITGSPMLRGEFFKTVLAREQALAVAIAERVSGPGADPDLDAQLLAAAYFGVARVVGNKWLNDDDADYLGMLAKALALLAPAAEAYERRRRQEQRQQVHRQDGSRPEHHQQDREHHAAQRDTTRG